MTPAKQWEKDFEEAWGALGKGAYLHRLTDAGDLYGLNKDQVINTNPLPADFVVSYKGWVGYAECKTTIQAIGFPLGHIRKQQMSHAKRLYAAGGNYLFAIKNLRTTEVFLVPAQVFFELRGNVPWSTLAEFAWKGGPPCLIPNGVWLTSKLPAPALTATP